MALSAKTYRLKEKLAKLNEEMAKFAAYEKQMLASPDQQISGSSAFRNRVALYEIGNAAQSSAGAAFLSAETICNGTAIL